MKKFKLPDPKIDSAFKYIYSSKGNENIAKSFANDIFGPEMKNHFDYIDKELHTEYPEIQNLHFKNCSLDSTRFGKKVASVDSMFADQDKKLCILEMQMAYQRDFFTRMMFYATKAWNNQLNIGDKYEKLRNISMIVITAYDLFPEEEDYLRYHPIMSASVRQEGGQLRYRSDGLHQPCQVQRAYRSVKNQH